MRKFKKLRVTVSLTCLILLGLVTGLASAEDFNSKSASVSAPQTVTASQAARSLAPPNPQAELARRQSRLSDHHRPVPISVAPLSIVRAAPPPSVMATSVTATTINLISNRPLTDFETSGITSTVNEPSTAVRDSEILVTGNWYATFSTDAGSTFSYINPATTFPTIPGQRFCCDQVALYDAQHDLMVWYLQYENDSSGNTGRLAVAQGNDIASRQWRFYDFTPQGVGNWSNEWFDFPDMAVGEKFLYITTNVFSTTTETFTRAVILRIPLDKLAAYQAFSLDYFDTSQNGSLRPTQGATDTMYFGSHNSTNNLRAFSWPENSTTISSDDITVQVWSNATRVAPGPDNRDWLGRADQRMTAAWLNGNEIGFAWTAAQDSNFPFPHVRVAIMNKSTKALTAQPHIWNSNFAFAYPAAAPNSDGRVGVSVHFGGGSQFFPSHAVGVLDSSGSNWELATTVKGTDGPSVNKWGDYLAVRPHGGNPQSWVATGFTLRGGSAASNIEPRYIHFSLDGDIYRLSLVLHPNRKLKKGRTTTARATVTINGVPAAGVTVKFKTANTSLATIVPPDEVITNSAGVAEATVRGEAKWWKSATTTVIAEVDGVTESTPVKVPDLSVISFLFLIGAFLFFAALRKRAKPA